MLLASLENVAKEYGAQTVLANVTFKVSTGQKLGLIGPNGSGKTTIARILLGHEPPSQGAAVIAKGVRTGYVPQYVEYDADQVVLDCVLTEHNRLAAALREREEHLATAGEVEMDRAMRAYERARQAYDRLGGDLFSQRARAMLDALGLAGRADQKIGSLSGGEQNVLAMTRALMAEPDLLVLDEPANHLDYVGVAWLEGFLSRFKGAVVIISHNRYLLDRVVDGILELQDGRVRYYDGGYSTYRATRLRELLAQQAAYAANQKRLAQLEALVKKFEQIARVNSSPKWGKRLRARRSQLARERSQEVARPTLGASSFRAEFACEPTRANIALQIRGYSKAFGHLRLFEQVDLDVACGERVALVGANGCGKTTLLRDIVEHGSWENAALRIGPSLRLGYCAQHQEVLRGDRTIFDEVLAAGPVNRKEASALLARFLFRPDDFQKRVAELSGGERNRVQLARLMVLKPNFLILDEPTNHLDIPAREAVEEAVGEFDGTILVVSHDRYFLDRIVDRVIEVRDRQLVCYPGNFTDFWLARKRAETASTGRVTKRRKDRERRSSKGDAADAIAALERRIHDAEQERVELERRIADAFTRRDQREGARAAKALERHKAYLEALYERWVAQSA